MSVAKETLVEKLCENSFWIKLAEGGAHDDDDDDDEPRGYGIDKESDSESGSDSEGDSDEEGEEQGVPMEGVTLNGHLVQGKFLAINKASHSPQSSTRATSASEEGNDDDDGNETEDKQLFLMRDFTTPLKETYDEVLLEADTLSHVSFDVSLQFVIDVLVADDQRREKFPVDKQS